MVEILRQKPVKEPVKDVSSMTNAIAGGMERLGGVVESVGNKWQNEQAKKDALYQKEIDQNLKTEAKNIADAQKAATAADKIFASDMAGQLENDLLRWNEEQKTKNPNAIGGKDYESTLRDQVALLSEKYGGNFNSPEAQQDFLKATQNAVNQMTQSNIKWDFAQRVKRGEQAAKRIADDAASTARFHGANKDIDGFKQTQAQQREKLKEYIEDVNPNAAPAALYESDKKNLKEWFIGLAQTDPKAARDFIKSVENFNKVLPDEMVENVQGVYRGAHEKQLNDELVKVNAAIESLPAKSPASKEYKKKKKKIEKELTEIPEYREESTAQIRKEIEDDIKPIIEKSLGENALQEVVADNYQKVQTFIDFTKVPENKTIEILESRARQQIAEQKEKNPNKWGDESTFRDFYRAANHNEPLGGDEAELGGLTDRINSLGIAEDDAGLAFDKVDRLIQEGMTEDDAIAQVFKEFKNTPRNTIDIDQEVDKRLVENPFLSRDYIEREVKQEIEDDEYIQNNPDTPAGKTLETIRQMKQYRKDFGNVSFKEVSSFRGTQQMYDNLKALVAADADGDGTPDNMILKGYQALNEAKKSDISQNDYETYEKIVMNAISTPVMRNNITKLVEANESYRPKNFWNKTISLRDPKATRTFETAKTKALQTAFLKMDAGQPIDKITSEYIQDNRNAYDAAVKNYGVNMPKLRQQHAEKGFALAEINGTQYIYQGDDADGNPIFEIPNFFSGMKAVNNNKKVKGNQ